MTKVRMVLKDRIEIMAQEMFKGETQSDGYRKAYPNSLKWKQKVVHEKSSTFAKSERVQERLTELREEAKERNKITVDSLLVELEENRQAALDAETVQSAAATGATMGKAKLLGLDKQIIEHTSPDGSMSPDGLTSEERKVRIQTLLSKQK